MDKMDKKKEVRALIILVGIIVLSIVIIYVFSKSLERIGIFLIGYMIFFICFSLLSSKFSNKFIKVVNLIFSFPFMIIYVVLKFSMPFSSTILHGFIFLVIVLFFPIVFMKSNSYFEFQELSKENYIFITLTFSSIVSNVFYKWIIKLVFKLSPIGLNDSQKTEKIKLKELIEYLITPQNIRFLIYSLYFIYMCIFSFKFLERKSFFETESVDTAIMQAFLTFLAFDSLRINSKEIKVLPSMVLTKILESFVSKDK